MFALSLCQATQQYSSLETVRTVCSSVLLYGDMKEWKCIRLRLMLMEKIKENKKTEQTSLMKIPSNFYSYSISDTVAPTIVCNIYILMCCLGMLTKSSL
jgi:hypothetical protein